MPTIAPIAIEARLPTCSPGSSGRPGTDSRTEEKKTTSKRHPSTLLAASKLGGAGRIGAAYVAKAARDGHPIRIYTSAFTGAPLLSPGPLDPKELTPVATLGTVPTVLVVSTAKNYKTVADLVAAAKAKAGAALPTSAGIRSSPPTHPEPFRISARRERL